MADRKKDKLDEVIARVKKANTPEGKEAARLAKLARVKPPRMEGSMANDRTGSRDQAKRKKQLEEDGAMEFRNGGKVSLGNFKGNF